MNKDLRDKIRDILGTLYFEYFKRTGYDSKINEFGLSLFEEASTKITDEVERFLEVSVK